MVVRHLKQIGKVKEFNSVPHELPENKKKSFWSVVFFYSTQQQQIISWLDCDVRQKVDFIWQPAMTSSVVGPRRSSKALPKAKIASKKEVMVTVGGLLLLWSTTTFWILLKPLHLRSTLNTSMRCTENCNACSWHWSTEWARFFPMTTPDWKLHSQGFRSWMNWAMKFCIMGHIHLTSHQLTLL